MAARPAESPFRLGFLAATGANRHKDFFPTNGDGSEMGCQWSDSNIGHGLSRCRTEKWGSVDGGAGGIPPTPLYERGATAGDDGAAIIVAQILEGVSRRLGLAVLWLCRAVDGLSKWLRRPTCQRLGRLLRCSRCGWALGDLPIPPSWWRWH